MSLRIIRNDITKMNTEAIVNTASARVEVGSGCDYAVYQAAGRDVLLAYRAEMIGAAAEGDAFLTPGFKLPAKYIIHAVSPLYKDGRQGEELKLRSCYRKCLALAKEKRIRSIAFPLIATGSFGYPKEEGLRIAVDECNAFLLKNSMNIYLVVFDTRATMLGEKLYPDLEAYIDRNYVKAMREEEYGDPYFGSFRPGDKGYDLYRMEGRELEERLDRNRRSQVRPNLRDGTSVSGNVRESALSSSRVLDETKCGESLPKRVEESPAGYFDGATQGPFLADAACKDSFLDEDKAAPARIEREGSAVWEDACAFEEQHERKLEERMRHTSDTFSQYLLYLIREKKMENAEVWKRAIVDKKVFSKIKNNPHYHPQKLTALCLCVGAKLNLDETRDLLARAGYALSPCDKTDIIFSYFIEHGIYDMIELDIQLEEHGLACIIA